MLAELPKTKPVLAGSLELTDPKLNSLFLDVSLPKENDGALGTTLADAAVVEDAAVVDDPLPNLKPVSAGFAASGVAAAKPVEAVAPFEFVILNLSLSSVRCVS